MRTRSALLVVLVMAVVGGAALASAASATVAPTGAKTGAATTSIAVAGMTCSGTNGFTSTWANATVPPAIISTDLQMAFGGCTRAPGGLSVSVTCTNRGVFTVTSVTFSGTTLVSLSSLSCTLTVSRTCTAQLTGGVDGRYDNASGQLTVALAGQTLALSGSTCTALPNGSTSLSASGGAAAVYAVSPSTTLMF